MSNKDEFSIIKRFFVHETKRRDVILGSGDDAAILEIPDNHQLVISTDTLVAGIHFFESVHPLDLGHKVLAANLSDIAAMGAQPAWVTMAMTLPHIDESWLQAFAQGFFALADSYQVELIGGDLTRGPLTITCGIHGFVPKNQALRRDKARVGDLIGVTGNLGDAGFALSILQESFNTDLETQLQVLPKLLRPEPRIQQGVYLRDLAHAAIDVSDGLLADLGHLLEQSHVGACVSVENIPFSPALRGLPREQALHYALNSGDDYELCFTISPENWQKLPANFPWYCIGEIDDSLKLRCLDSAGREVRVSRQGYKHF
jgi:thiamine-monophosphate kinase